MPRREKNVTRDTRTVIMIMFLETDHHFFRTTRLLLKDKMIENDTKGHNTVGQTVPVHKISRLLTNKN